MCACDYTCMHTYRLVSSFLIITILQKGSAIIIFERLVMVYGWCTIHARTHIVVFSYNYYFAKEFCYYYFERLVVVYGWCPIFGQR